MLTKLSKKSSDIGGFTLIDNVFAVGIIALGFSALYAMSSQCLKLDYAAREEMTASQGLQDRGDSLRQCTWAQITDPTYLSANIMNKAANKAPLMNKMAETVTINAYPTPAATPIQLTRSSAGVVTIVSQNSAIANGDMVKIDVQMAWTSWSGNRSHTETLSTIFAENPR